MGFKEWVVELRAAAIQIDDARVGCSACTNKAPLGLYEVATGMKGSRAIYMLVCRRCYMKAASTT